MTRDTPSPQSVVVPVERLSANRERFNEALAGVPDVADRRNKGQQFNAYDLDDEGERKAVCIGPITSRPLSLVEAPADVANLIEAALRLASDSLLAATPHPLAMTGGEWLREDYGNSTLLYTLKEQGWRKGEPVMVNDKTVRVEFDGDREPVIAAILAALSPEAPACDDCGSPLNSDGECTRDLAEREADDRHEAPADDDDGPCTCCDDTGTTIQTERPCACAAGIPHEAPAEGAGESVGVIGRLEEMADFFDGATAPVIAETVCDEHARDLRHALRVLRAPEAREGEAVAWAIFWRHAMTLHATLEDAKTARKGVPHDIVPLYTHSAAPSADKLQIAVEALDTAREAIVGWFEAIDVEVRVKHEMHVTLKDDLANIDHALAALKAEGAK